MSTRVVIVTGASRGIGAAICAHLLKPLQACNVVGVARTEAPLRDLSERNDGRMQYVVGDIVKADTAKRAVGLAIERWGRVDGLVINHGTVSPVARIADANVDEWTEGFNINVASAVRLIQLALPHIRKEHGRIILTSSGAAVKGTATWGSYCASKACLNSLARTLAAEEPDITSVAVRPGVVDTEMQDELAREHFDKMEEKDADRFRTLRSEGKMLRPDQPGNVMARLVLDAGKELDGRFLDWNDKDLSKFQDL